MRLDIICIYLVVSAIKSRIFRRLRHMNNNDFYTKMLPPIIHTCTDIQLEVVPVPFKDLSTMREGEPSSVIRQRVIKARKIQQERFKDFPDIHCNAQMNSRMMKQFCKIQPSGMELLRTIMDKLQLSARAYDRILKVSRTIADLEGCEQIQDAHLAEAITYRSLDRESWGR